MELTCPKCHGSMRSYERGGVTVDQCSDCRGIFLDRGELERLIDAEASHHSPSAPAYAGRDDDRSRDDREHRDDGRHDERRPQGDYRYSGDDHYRKKKRRSFLEELFD